MSEETQKATAKTRLGSLALEMDKRLKLYWKKEMGANFGFEKNQKKLIRKLLSHAKEHNLRQAKRLRASLVYYGYLMGKTKPNEEIWKAMEAVELVQTALLMHDDFMDEDKLRRGLPTTQEYFAEGDKHYGESMAVDVGDVVLCLGFERMMECNFDEEKVLRATKLLIRGITETGFGQAFDISLPKLGGLTERKVLAVHRTKTAIYTFQNPLVVGGVLAGLAEKDLDILKEYAVFAGIAFQLQDDVLGMFGDSKKTGKSADSDLLQGKSTLLVARTLEKGDGQQKKILLAAWGNKKAKKAEIEAAKKVIIESGAYEYSVAKANKLVTKAIEMTEKMDKRGFNKEAVEYLRGIAEYMVAREI